VEGAAELADESEDSFATLFEGERLEGEVEGGEKPARRLGADGARKLRAAVRAALNK
jgi:hypothetical protein